MRVDPGTTSSHGFVINLHIALLNFATPFMDSTYSKVSFYLLKNLNSTKGMEC